MTQGKIQLAIVQVIAAIVLVTSGALAGSARPQGACAYLFDEARQTVLAGNEGAAAHDMTAAEVAAFAAARGVEHMDRATWFESPAYSVVYVLVGAGGCVVYGTEMAPERLREILADE